jgi:hypothetical protein
MEIARKASRRKPKHIRRDNWNPQSGARTARGANYGKSIRLIRELSRAEIVDDDIPFVPSGPVQHRLDDLFQLAHRTNARRLARRKRSVGVAALRR